jgi:hypothetical protein
LTDLKTLYPVSPSVARFVDRLANLSTADWESIQHAIGVGGVELTMLEASRNAAVALAVRDLISPAQFEHLYRPFRILIPLASLEQAATLD